MISILIVQLHPFVKIHNISDPEKTGQNKNCRQLGGYCTNNCNSKEIGKCGGSKVCCLKGKMS